LQVGGAEERLAYELAELGVVIHDGHRSRS